MLLELLRQQGFAGGALRNAHISLEELVARDGGLPFFLAQAGAWAEIMGVPSVVAPYELAADEAALAHSRVVMLEAAPSQHASYGAPLLLLLNHVVHVARDLTPGDRLKLNTLVQPPSPGVCDALSVRGWPASRAARPAQ